MTAVIAMKASPPGLFSTTTGWPHLADSLSANTRAVMSTPEPGPSGITNLTGCCGHVCAGDGAAVDTSAAKPQRIKARIERRGLSMVFPSNIMDGEYVNRCGRLLSSRTAMPPLQLYSAEVRMQICAAGISVRGNVGRFPPLVMEFSQN